MDGHHRDLGVSFFVNLPAEVVHLRNRVLVQNVSKVVDVVGGFKLRDRLGLRHHSQQQRTGQTQPPFWVRIHGKENCTGQPELAMPDHFRNVTSSVQNADNL